MVDALSLIKVRLRYEARLTRKTLLFVLVVSIVDVFPFFPLKDLLQGLESQEQELVSVNNQCQAICGKLREGDTKTVEMKLHHLNEQWHEAKLKLEERRKYLEWDVCSLGEYQQLIGQADSKRIEIESLISSLDSADREVPEVEEECKVPQDRDDYQFSLMGQYQGMGDWT